MGEKLVGIQPRSSVLATARVGAFSRNAIIQKTLSHRGDRLKVEIQSLHPIFPGAPPSGSMSIKAIHRTE